MYILTHTYIYIYIYLQIYISKPPTPPKLTLLDPEIFHFDCIKYWNEYQHEWKLNFLIFFPLAFLEKSLCVPGI